METRSRIKATIITEGDEVSTLSEHFKEEMKQLPSDARYQFGEFALKMELCAITNPLVKKTSLSNFKVVNDIVDNISLETLSFISDSTRAASYLSSILTGELYRLGVEASNYTQQDYSLYVTQQTPTLNSLAIKIYDLIK